MASALSARRAGWDVLRLAAMSLVFFQHAFSMAGRDELIGHFGLSLGRLGTTLFFLIGGYFASVAARSPEAWLGMRLRRLFLPYWIVLAVSFGAVWITQYKPFDAWQVVCQFAGIGWFTHPGRIVGVPTWFITAILVLYLVAYLAKRSHERLAVVAILVGFFAFREHLPGDLPSRACAAVMFFVAYTIGWAGDRALRVTVLWLIALAAGSLFEPQLRYGAVSLALFAVSSRWQGSWSPAHRLAAYSYEWYLVHGLALHAAVRLLAAAGLGDHLLWLIVVAGALSLAGSIALARGARLLDSSLADAFARLRLDAPPRWRLLGNRSAE